VTNLHPFHHARDNPDHPAMIIADTGETLTYAKLDEASNRIAHLLRSFGVQPGERIAVIIGNWLAFPVVYWGAQRAGIMITLISRHLKAEEAAYIINDSAAKALFIAPADGETAQRLVQDRARLIPGVENIVTGPEVMDGALEMVPSMSTMPTTPVAHEISGFHMIYSSGTTGRPKGVAMPFTPGPIDQPHQSEGNTRLYEGFKPLVSFNAGPLYHGAPLNCMLLTQRLGGTFVTLKKFDAEAVLRAIETHQVNHAQFVPTMFVRLLALDEAVRARYDLSSLKFVLHAAAPCPVEIKRRMIDWLGPIVGEYYASTEGVGSTYITSQEWLAKPGSVGKSALGPIHICDDEGRELPAGEAGVIWFEAPEGRYINYLNDPEKTKKATHPEHANWYTVGDIGRLDENGYLFLTDRKDFMIISGGVNIYPQAIEDCLIIHPQVLDAAVIGVADAEFGEEVKAIIQPKDWADAGPELEAGLRDWCATRISRVTQPRSYEFVEELPRLPSGKLAKHELRTMFGAPVENAT
jgi:long-chain acyl-CoA synthetase